jgi:hypothetical protein
LDVRRLLGQSCRPQSFGTIDIHPVAPDPLAAKIENARVWRVDRCAAALPASFEPSKHKHPVAEIAELLRERLELLQFSRISAANFSTPSRPR